jgi:hypothetical protein
VGVLGRVGVALVGVCLAAGVWPACGVAFPARVYELVSPTDKTVDVLSGGGTVRGAGDGHAVTYQSLGSGPEAVSRGLFNEFRSARGSGGWVTRVINPPLDPLPGTSLPVEFQAVSPDADFGAAWSWGLESSGRPQMKNLWRYRALDGAFDLLSVPQVDLVPESGRDLTDGNSFAGASDRFDHIVFHSSKALLAGLPPDPGFGVTGSSIPYLYEWSETGGVRAFGYLPADEGGGLVVGSVLGYANPNATNKDAPGDYAVSADGSRIFFSSGQVTNPDRRLYVSSDGGVGGRVSELVSGSERVGCVGDPGCGATGEFQRATPDGSMVLFTSPAKLTDDATASNSGGFGPTNGVKDPCGDSWRCDLYLWDGDRPVGQRLTDLTTADAGGGGVFSVVGASDDLSRVFFVATGDLDVAGEGVEGQPNLYVWDPDQGVRLIATLDGSNTGQFFARDSQVWSTNLFSNPPTLGFRAASASRDGRFLVFSSRLSLTGFDTAGRYQVYRYDAVTGGLVCVSCNTRTGVSGGDAFLRRAPGGTRPAWLSRNVFGDGRVVFESPEGLVAGDSNAAFDVYEWDGGSVGLVSSGVDADESAFVDASESGGDVFFTTRARLVERDRDDLVDVYDARVGGDPAFGRLPVKAACSGDGCQGAPAGVPVFERPATVGGGPGDQPAAKQKAKAKHKRAKAKRCRKGRVRRRVGGRSVCVKKRASKSGAHVVAGGRGR